VRVAAEVTFAFDVRRHLAERLSPAARAAAIITSAKKLNVIIGICSFVSRITPKKLLNGFSENSVERRHMGHVKILLAMWITWLKQ